MRRAQKIEQGSGDCAAVLGLTALGLNRHESGCSPCGCRRHGSFVR